MTRSITSPTSWPLVLLTMLGVAMWSTGVWACPSCVDPRDANADAFIGSTVALSLIPLAFIFAIVVYVVRAERRAQMDAP
jgi:hypothetical protein